MIRELHKQLTRLVTLLDESGVEDLYLFDQSTGKEITSVDFITYDDHPYVVFIKLGDR